MDFIISFSLLLFGTNFLFSPKTINFRIVAILQMPLFIFIFFFTTASAAIFGPSLFLQCFIFEMARFVAILSLRNQGDPRGMVANSCISLSIAEMLFVFVLSPILLDYSVSSVFDPSSIDIWVGIGMVLFNFSAAFMLMASQTNLARLAINVFTLIILRYAWMRELSGEGILEGVYYHVTGLVISLILGIFLFTARMRFKNSAGQIDRH